MVYVFMNGLLLIDSTVSVPKILQEPIEKPDPSDRGCLPEKIEPLHLERTTTWICDAYRGMPHRGMRIQDPICRAPSNSSNAAMSSSGGTSPATHAGGTLAEKSEEVLTTMKALAVREENAMVARVTLHNMKQDHD